MQRTLPTDPLSPHQHRRIYLDIERKIASGEIRDKEQLPVLGDLCEQYGVSAASVRRALDDLERNGLIAKRRGKGTFAIHQPAKMQTLRVLLIGEKWDLYRSPIEFVHYMFDMLAGVRDRAREQGTEVAIISQAGPGRLPPVTENMGYLVITMGMNSYELGLELAQSQGVPCVLVNPPESLEPCVRVDIAEAAYLGVRYLAGLGHRRIAYMGGLTGSFFAERVEGYRRALDEAGLTFDPDLVRQTFSQAADNTALFDRLIAMPEPPTAIFAASDYFALELMTHARIRGIRVPEDLSICGYDNINEAASSQPGLTTVHHPRYELGQAAVSLLNQLLAGETPDTLDVTVAPHVVVRESTGRGKGLKTGHD